MTHTQPKHMSSLCSHTLNYKHMFLSSNGAGIATRYGLDGPGIKSLPIPVAKRSKARVWGRSLAGNAGSNPGRGMDGCIVFVSKHKKAEPRTIKTKKQVPIEYKQRTREFKKKAV